MAILLKLSSVLKVQFWCSLPMRAIHPLEAFKASSTEGTLATTVKEIAEITKDATADLDYFESSNRESSRSCIHLKIFQVVSIGGIVSGEIQGFSILCLLLMTRLSFRQSELRAIKANRISIHMQQP